MLASQVSTYLSIQKQLVGVPVWLEGNRPDQYRLQWPVVCGGVGSGPHVEVDFNAAAPCALFSISLMVPPPISRLDVGEFLKHVVRGAKKQSPKTIRGHHFHPWSRNGPPRGVETIPKELSYCEPYEESADFCVAFVWFCRRVNIEVDLNAVPELPRRRMLL